MPPRVRDRKAGLQTALPTLSFCCQMCEAEFPNRRAHDEHVNMVHGGSRWYINAFHSFHELQPYVVSPTENRGSVQRFARVQQYGVKEFENEPYQEPPQQSLHKLLLPQNVGTLVPLTHKKLCLCQMLVPNPLPYRI